MYTLSETSEGSGSMIHWTSTSLSSTVSSTVSELQALESATSVASRVVEYYKTEGLLVQVKFFSDAKTLIYQVLKQKDLAPPYGRYIPTIFPEDTYMIYAIGS